MPGCRSSAPRRGAAAWADQHGRADQPRRGPGHRHEPRADVAGRRAHLFRLRRHAAVLSADRPRARPSRARPGARDRRAAADLARHRRGGAAGGRQRHATRQHRCRRASACWSAWASASASTVSWNAESLRSMPAWSPAKACRSPARGTQVFAGTLNLGAALTVRATATGARHTAGRMRPADRGGGGAALAVRGARRPGGAALCAGGASDRAATFCGGSASPASPAGRRC